MKKVAIKNFFVGDGERLTIISGPCVIEDKESCLKAAEYLKNLFAELDVNFIFKSSFDKANRSSVHSYRGPGMREGLKILAEVKKKLDIAITTDIHLPEQAEAARDVVDLIQIPALLCRQTDLLLTAGRTGRAVSLKKGQFLSPWDMKNAIDKILSTGNDKIILIERGTSFGYNNLVSDFRAIPVMRGFGFPVCFDATHSIQLPGSLGKRSGGQKEFTDTLALAATAAGADALFMESHPEPDKAYCDSTSVVDFKKLSSLVARLKEIFAIIRK